MRFIFFPAEYVCLCGVCSVVTVLGRSVTSSWCPVLWVGDCGACTVVCVACVYTERGWDDDGNAGVGAVESVVAVSAWCDYMCGTHGSGVVSCTDDVLEMSVVRGVRSVGGV